MKKSALSVLIVLFLIFASNVIAAPIPVEVINSSFHVTGGYSYDFIGSDFSPYGLSGSGGDSYDKSGTSAQYGLVDFIMGSGSAEGAALSYAGLFNVDSQSASRNITFMGGPFAQASAEADVTFRPLNDFNALNFSYIADYVYYSFEGSLTDLTDNVVIWALSEPWRFGTLFGDYQNGIDTGTINYAFQSDHLYSMHLYTYCNAWDDDTLIRFEFPDLKRVPEPTTMLLLGLGLVGLAGVRRKFRQ